MNLSLPWLAFALAALALGLALVGALVLIRVFHRTPPVTPEERAELASLPMSPLQKLAWAGFGIGALQSLAIGVVFAARGGAAVYEQDHSMRLVVAGLFVVGLALSGILSVLVQFKADERERWVLAWGPRVQSLAVLIAVALGTVFLVERFHDAGAIPVVYAYLAIGTIFIVHVTTYFLGLLIGFRATQSHGQG